jgi:H+/Cl- antiporter ClcA
MISPLFAMMPVDEWINLLGACAAIAVIGVFFVRVIRARNRVTRRHFPLSVIAFIVAIGFGALSGVLEALAHYDEPFDREHFWAGVFCSALIGVFVGFLLLVVVDLPRLANGSEPTNKT